MMTGDGGLLVNRGREEQVLKEKYNSGDVETEVYLSYELPKQRYVIYSWKCGSRKLRIYYKLAIHEMKR